MYHIYSLSNLNENDMHSMFGEKNNHTHAHARHMTLEIQFLAWETPIIHKFDFLRDF